MNGAVEDAEEPFAWLNGCRPGIFASVRASRWAPRRQPARGKRDSHGFDIHLNIQMFMARCGGGAPTQPPADEAPSFFRSARRGDEPNRMFLYMMSSCGAVDQNVLTSPRVIADRQLDAPMLC
jgi:hypothetical protein